MRSVKSALRKSVGMKCLSRVELETTLQEIEACVNSRPLTFVGDDVESLNPLSPSHFLIGRCAGFVSRVTENDTMVTVADLRARDASRQESLDMFWERWRTEYLRNLPTGIEGFNERGKLEVGTVVLIHEDNVPRLKWPLGLVTELLTERDGIVRSVKVRTKSGVIVRSVQRLHVLECSSDQLTDYDGKVRSR